MIIAELKFWTFLMLLPPAVYLVGYLLVRRSLNHDKSKKAVVDQQHRQELSHLAYANMAVVLNLSTLPPNLFIKESWNKKFYHQIFDIGAPAVNGCDCLLPSKHYR